MKTWQLEWPCGELEVQSLGAMLGPAHFHLSDRRQVQPFAVAPWAQEPHAQQLPGILQRLRGEWPCVPLGGSEPLTGLAKQWQPQEAVDALDFSILPLPFDSEEIVQCGIEGSFELLNKAEHYRVGIEWNPAANAAEHCYLPIAVV